MLLSTASTKQIDFVLSYCFKSHKVQTGAASMCHFVRIIRTRLQTWSAHWVSGHLPTDPRRGLDSSLLDPQKTNTNDCRGHCKRWSESPSLPAERQTDEYSLWLFRPAALWQLDAVDRWCTFKVFSGGVRVFMAGMCIASFFYLAQTALRPRLVERKEWHWLTIIFVILVYFLDKHHSKIIYQQLRSSLAVRAFWREW